MVEPRRPDRADDALSLVPLPGAATAPEAPRLESRRAELIARVEGEPLSPPDDPLAFECRLADDAGWTLGHAIAVTFEYRRFLVLTQVADVPPAPPPDVDRAWRLHLTRTVDYERMCRDVLGGFVHREPVRGFERAYRNGYADVAAVYLHVFGHRPPEAIWPEPTARADDGRREPAIAGWQVPTELRAGHRLFLAAAVLAAAVGAALQGLGVAHLLPAMSGPTFLVVATGATSLLAGLAWWGRTTATPSSVRDRLDPYEAAWLEGGVSRMASTAIATLVERGTLLVRDPATLMNGVVAPLALNTGVAPDVRHPAERDCVGAVAGSGLRPGDALRALEPLAWSVGQRLVRAGLCVDAGRLSSSRTAALAGAALLLAVEVERLVDAFGTLHPVGLLVVLMCVNLALIAWAARLPRRGTARAEAQLRRLRLAHGSARQHGPHVGTALSFAVALTGVYAVTSDERFAGLASALGFAPRQRHGDGPLARGRGRSGGGDGDGGAGCGADGSSCSSLDLGGGGASDCSNRVSSCSGSASSCSSGGSSCSGGSGSSD